MARDIRKVAKPFPFRMDIAEYDNVLSVVVYENDIRKMSESERQRVMGHILMVRDIIQSHGVPCEVEGRNG